MFGSDDSPQLDAVLKICSQALTQLSIVPRDEYNNPSDNKRLIARMALDLFAKSIAENITELTKNLNYKNAGFGYVRDEFVVSGDNEQFDYFVTAIQSVRPIGLTTDSYNSTILFAWGVYNSKTDVKINNYILEERQEQNELTYLLRIFDDEEDSVPSHIYGTNPPMDIYYSTKLVLIHTLNGKGNLAKLAIDDIDYVMILTNDEHAAEIVAKQSVRDKQIIDRKQSDL
ncbi:hypothetical protein I4U23_010946 [Adineta vaga]|nr:hypothetical protein I4U23_010946 [Adineta vaga]